jgi:hypothetical protein
VSGHLDGYFSAGMGGLRFAKILGSSQGVLLIPLGLRETKGNPNDERPLKVGELRLDKLGALAAFLVENATNPGGGQEMLRQSTYTPP